jgi:hypothetical protein
MFQLSFTHSEAARLDLAKYTSLATLRAKQ